MSAPLIVDWVAEVVFCLAGDNPPREHLDMGAGLGDLIKRLRTQFPAMKSWALDYNPSNFSLKDVPIAHANFSLDRLPFDDEKFDLVTCTEVVEHLENFRHALREAARVVRPGGLLVVSTPNIISMKSRWAFLTRGLFTHFDPLPLKDDTRMYPGGRHITPIPFFHLAHALRDCGLVQIEMHTDRTQRSSATWAFFLRPFLRAATRRNVRRRRKRFFALPEEMEELGARHNSWTALTGRTLIVSARKAGAAATR